MVQAVLPKKTFRKLARHALSSCITDHEPSESCSTLGAVKAAGRSQRYAAGVHPLRPAARRARGRARVAGAGRPRRRGATRTLAGLRERVLQRFLCLAACISLDHGLGRLSRTLVDYCASGCGRGITHLAGRADGPTTRVHPDRRRLKSKGEIRDSGSPGKGR